MLTAPAWGGLFMSLQRGGLSIGESQRGGLSIGGSSAYGESDTLPQAGRGAVGLPPISRGGFSPISRGGVSPIRAGSASDGDVHSEAVRLLQVALNGDSH